MQLKGIRAVTVEGGGKDEKKERGEHEITFQITTSNNSLDIFWFFLEKELKQEQELKLHKNRNLDKRLKTRTQKLKA